MECIIVERSYVREVLLDLIRESSLTPQQVDSRIEKALSPEYWIKLNPALTIGEPRIVDTIHTAEPDTQWCKELTTQFASDGYFHTDVVYSTDLIRQMRDSVCVLREEDWPPVFTFVYDQFWAIYSSRYLIRLITSLLGGDYKRIPHLWTFHVMPHPGATGWRPHTDGRRPRRLTIWIPLTDATLDNGCMYVLPKSGTPKRVLDSFKDLEGVDFEELSTLLQACRALPARAGSILGWDFSLIHWGARCNQPQEPRISISLEFIAADVAPWDDELPLIDPNSTPSFSQRLQIVARTVLCYAKFEPLMLKYKSLAERLA